MDVFKKNEERETEKNVVILWPLVVDKGNYNYVIWVMSNFIIVYNSK